MGCVARCRYQEEDSDTLDCPEAEGKADRSNWCAACTESEPGPARSQRERTLREVLIRLVAFGPATCRELATGLYGEGRTRTRERARVHEALKELEGTDQVERTRPAEYFEGSADVWSACE